MDLQSFQRRFAAALIDPTSSECFFSQGKQNRAALAIYRNNVAYSLREVLGEDFPVVKRLLGEALFNALALDFVRKHLPTSRSLIDYGLEFPDFLQHHRQVADYPWLCEVAQIEMTRREVFYAADDEALLPQHIEGLTDQEITELHFRLRSSCRFLPLMWQADKIWLAHQKREVPEMEITREENCLLIRRQSGNILIERLGQDVVSFLRALQAGASLGGATSAVLERYAKFNLTDTLALCFTRALFQKGGTSDGSFTKILDKTD